MFNFLRRKKTAAQVMADDVESVLLRTFSELASAKDDPHELTRCLNVVVTLASTCGAIRGAYPSASFVEEDSMAVAVVEASAARNYEQAFKLCDALFDFINRFDDTKNNRLYAALWLIAPVRAKELRESTARMRSAK